MQNFAKGCLICFTFIIAGLTSIASSTYLAPMVGLTGFVVGAILLAVGVVEMALLVNKSPDVDVPKVQEAFASE